MFELQSISFSLPDRTLLRPLSLSIAHGRSDRA
jgi:hypothetical protein